MASGGPPCPPHQVAIGIRNLRKEVSQHLRPLGQIRWHIRWQHLLFDEEALSGISGGLGLDHVVGPDRPSPLQIPELVPGLVRGGAARVELLDHPTWLVEVLVDDALGATPDLLANPRHAAHP